MADAPRTHMSKPELPSIDLTQLAKVTGGNITAPQTGSTQITAMLQEITTAIAQLGGNSGAAGLTGAAPASGGTDSMQQMMSMMMMMMGKGGGMGGMGGSGGLPF
jgi:hypothetical protein